ncbi:hypothetical protein AVEN_73798-1 [Araneus ventricosus]|uniref:Uncharacterized protein n=1 Tax=Araneus ventricosus TaxID=182803 RepID=A0A4Y2HE36_ARAVE|nr:hypothetical protein AVEN_73798-1 [Araneus ventricosus]
MTAMTTATVTAGIYFTITEIVPINKPEGVASPKLSSVRPVLWVWVHNQWVDKEQLKTLQNEIRSLTETRLKSQRKRIRGLTPQFDQRPHSPSKRTSHRYPLAQGQAMTRPMTRRKSKGPSLQFDQRPTRHPKRLATSSTPPFQTEYQGRRHKEKKSKVSLRNLISAPTRHPRELATSIPAVSNGTPRSPPC